MELLSGSESDSANKDNGFRINKKYAKHYEQWRRKEEKQKLLDKYGNEVLDSDSESEDEIRTTQKLDKEWLRAYAVVRFQQPRLYSGEKLFNEEVKPVPKKGEKKTTLKDHERKFVLEKGGVASEDEDEDFGKQAAGPGYYEEQEEIKSSLKKAISQIEEDDDDEDEDSLLVKKTKSDKEKEDENNDYLAWLKGEKEELEDKQASEELAPLKAYWSDPNLTDKEKVLRDYILNNGYMDKEGSDDDDEDDEDDDEDDSDDFEEEEKFLDQADKYEKTYNFRHEEPGGIEIKTYPRYIESSVRVKEDNKRVEKRKRKAEKKQHEKDQRMEEIKTLQRLQKEEKEEKLQKLKDMAENQDLQYDLEGDFDPEEHEKIMKKYFDASFYHEEVAGEKPVFEDDIEEGNYGDKADTWWHGREEDQKDVHKEEWDEDDELYADDPEFIMDADYDPSAVEAEKQSKKEAKKSKKEQKKAKKNKKLDKAPLFDPTTKTFDEYLDEYLTDKINTLPFTYRQVMPNDFGLSTEEILSAADRELNSWASVKKMSMYRTTDEEKNDIHKYKVKGGNVYKKHKTLPSLASQQQSETRDIPAIKKKKKKKKKQKAAEENDGVDADSKADVSSGETNSTERPELNTDDKVEKQKKKKNKKRKIEEAEEEILEQLEPKKKKKKLKSTEDNVTSELSLNDSSLQNGEEIGERNVSVTSSPDKNKQKKKKKKRMENIEEVNISESKSTKEENDKPGRITDRTSEGSRDKMSDQNEKRLGHADNSNHSGSVKKNKKKKSKLKIEADDEEGKEHRPVVEDKTKTKKKLKKLMSASRMGSYGIGPGARKHGNKLNKKKKKPMGHPG